MNTRILTALAASFLLAACSPPEERAATYVANAQAHYDQGDYIKARLEAQNAAQVEPKNAQARYLLALIAEQEEDFRAMFGHLSMAVDSDPTNVEAQLKLATLYFLGQAWDDAQEHTDVLLELAPEDARVHLIQARLLVQRGERAEGMAEIDRALELDPDFVEAILLKAAAEGIEDLDQGLAILDAAIERFPADETRQLRELRIVMLAQGRQTDAVEAGLADLTRDFPDQDVYQFQLARFYTSQGRVDEAERLLRQVVQLDPEDDAKRLGFVNFLVGQRGTENAEATLQAFIEEDPDSSRLRLALGQLYEQTDRPAQARTSYQELVKLDPRSEYGMQARIRLAALDMSDGEVQAARLKLEDILKDEPDQSDALLLRATLLYNERRFDEVIADLRGVLRKDPREHRALLLMGQTYVQRDDLTMAKDSYRRLLEVRPDSEEGLVQLAMLHAAERDFNEAETLLRRRLEAHPEDVLASGRLVEVLMADGRMDAAEKEARRLADATGETGVGDFSLGRVLAQQKDYDAAADAFRRSLKNRTDDPMPLEGLVRSLIAAGKQDEAIETLNSQLDNEATKLFAKYLLGGIYGETGNAAQAEKYLEDVIRERPESVIAYASLGASYKDDAEARIRTYRRGLEAVPGNPQLSLLLGTEFERSARHDDALAVYEELVKHNPDYLPGINNLAATLLDHRSDKDSHTRAMQLARRLSEVDNPAMLDTLGWAYYRNGQYDEAVRTLERVVAQIEGVGVFNYHLGMAYLAAGNTVGARQQLEQAVTSAGNGYPGLEEARARLEELKAAG